MNQNCLDRPLQRLAYTLEQKFQAVETLVNMLSKQVGLIYEQSQPKLRKFKRKHKKQRGKDRIKHKFYSQVAPSVEVVKSLLKKSTRIPEEIFERVQLSSKPEINLLHFRTRTVFRVIKPLKKNLKLRASSGEADNQTNYNIESESNKRKLELKYEDTTGSYPTKSIFRTTVNAEKFDAKYS